MFVVSGYQAREILDGLKKGVAELTVSLDLGLSKSAVRAAGDGVVFPDGQRLPADTLKKMARRQPDCFYLEDGLAYKIQCFSPQSSRLLKLYATGPGTAPTVQVSGIRMHQTKDVDPIADTLSKLDSVGVRGSVLDTCTGLGYTAVYSLRKGASSVVTVEEEPLMLEVAKTNPWSQQLFSDDRITLLEGDSSEMVEEFPENTFDCIIHDPPRMALAGQLYSLQFYRQLHRILKAGGRLFHYVGSPGGRYRRRNLLAGVKNRLEEAGFAAVKESHKAKGLRAFK